MNAFSERLPLQQQALDWLFARLGGAEEEPVPQAEPDRPDEAADVGPTPEVRSPEDLRAAADWLRRERQRLAAYTRSQLAWVQQEHQSLLQQKYHSEQGLILRAQELARNEEMIVAKGRSLQEQADDLARREQSLVGQLQSWWQANEELAALQEATQTVRQDADSHRMLLETLQAETAALQGARAQARVELEGLLSAAEQARASREKEEAAYQARQAELERRMLAAEQSALTSDQRLAELDDLEARLRAEFEEQERELQRQRRELTALETRLRAEGVSQRLSSAGRPRSPTGEGQRCSDVRSTLQLSQERRSVSGSGALRPWREVSARKELPPPYRNGREDPPASP